MTTDVVLTLDETGSPARWRSPGARALRSLLKKKIACVAIVYLTIFYGAGLFAPLVVPALGLPSPYEQNRTLGEVRAGPSREHPLGTDTLGRDMAARVIYSARTTVLFTIVVLITGGLFIGLGLGLLAGYRGGWVDTLIMRVGEVFSGLPTLFIMLALSAAFRTRIDDLIFWFKDKTFLADDSRAIVQFLLIAMVTVPFAWVGSSRIVRAQTLSIRESGYVEAAELMGAGTWRVVTRHILPGVMPLFLVGLSGGMAAIAGSEVALSFLGLGISPPTASFGTMIGDGAGIRAFQAYPHLLLDAALPVMVFFFAWNLLGDALVDVLQPKQHTA